MGIGEVILVGLGLSMDAAAVSLTNGMVYKIGLRKAAAMAGLFGLFQALMPCLGYLLGGLFADFLTRASGLLVALILGVLGLRMLWSAWRQPGKQEEVQGGNLSLRMMLLQSLATSIDAFAVGVGFRAATVNMWLAAPAIGVTTLICSLVATFLGRKFGAAIGRWAEVLGGCILVFLAIKALF